LNSLVKDRRGRFARPIVSIMMDILPGAKPLIVDVRQTRSSPQVGVRDVSRVFVIDSTWCHFCNDTSNIDDSTHGGSGPFLYTSIGRQRVAHSPDYHDRGVYTVGGECEPWICRLVCLAESETYGAGGCRSGAGCRWSVRDR